MSEETRGRSGSVSRKKTVVSEKVAAKMSLKPSVDSNDFTLHITEAGEEVRTTTRICKGDGI
jgi:hypothetical protein